MRITYTTERGPSDSMIGFPGGGGKIVATHVQIGARSITIPGHRTRAELLPYVGHHGEHDRFRITMARLRDGGLISGKITGDSGFDG